MAMRRENDASRVPNINNSYTGVSSVDNMVKKIREDRIAKAAPNSPESKGRWTDNTRLH